MALRFIQNGSSETFSSDDVAFIKTHHRYPLNSYRKLKPLIYFLLMMMVFTVLLSLLLNTSMHHRLRGLAPLLPSCLIYIVGLYQFRKSLLFEKMSTPVSEFDTITLLQAFFKYHHFSYYNMPSNPEVFMMQGSSGRPLDDDREVVVFICMDDYILINSHFSTSSIFPKGRPHYRELIYLFQEFLSIHLNERHVVLHDKSEMI